MRKLMKTLAAMAAFAVASGALAAPPAGTRNDGHRPVKLSEQTELLGASVPPGSYDLRWTREPGTESVTLEVTRGKRVVASGKGVWASATGPYPHEALVYSNATGAKELSQIRFRGSADLIKVETRATGPIATSDR
jgi:hypothetical protein